MRKTNVTKTLFFKKYFLPKVGASDVDRKSVFNDVNALSSNIRKDIEKIFSNFYIQFPELASHPALSEKIQKCAAYTALSESFVEFLNNANDAHATEINFALVFSSHANESHIEIIISDNGDDEDLIETDKPYSWKLITKPSKKTAFDANGDLITAPRGQHSALAIISFYLAYFHGKLVLTRVDEKTKVILESDLTAAPYGTKSDEYCFGQIKGLNVVECILIDIIARKDSNLADVFSGDSEATYWYDKERLDCLLSTINNPSEKVRDAITCIQGIAADIFSGTTEKQESTFTLDELDIKKAKERLHTKSRARLFQQKNIAESVLKKPLNGIKPA